MYMYYSGLYSTGTAGCGCVHIHCTLHNGVVGLEIWTYGPSVVHTSHPLPQLAGEHIHAECIGVTY